MVKLASPTGKPKLLAAVHPRADIEAEYHRRLNALIEEMHASLLYWLKAAYRAQGLAQDGPAESINRVMLRLAKRWMRRFDDAAPDIARYFATEARDRTDDAMRKALKKAGFTVRFQITPAVRNVFEASLAENVGLIRSIAQEHLADVQGAVMRSVVRGGDLATLADDLAKRYDITRNRAAFIARDQNAKATAVITAARQVEIGVKECRWVHSSGGRHPRASHVKAGRDRLTYNPAKGAKIDGEWIFPGQLPNCRCIGRSIIPGFE
jgi:uncharacterized protein with gpF-like domain